MDLWNIQKIVSKGDYDYAVVPEHPKATKHGYVLLHRIVMENYLGRILEDNEIAHHIKEDEKKNNNIENLELCLDYIHSKFHALQHGRTFLLITCAWCGKMFEREKRQVAKNKSGIYYCCKSCGTYGQYKGQNYDNNIKEFIKNMGV